MRRLILIVAALGLLTGVGVAVAHDGQGKTVKQAADTTFTATTGGNVRTETCTGSDGATYQSTHGEWTGTATGDPALTGNATIDADAVVNTTTGYGEVSGRIQIDTSTGGHVSANFDSVDTNGNIAGLAESQGHGWHDSGTGQLVANLSAAWSPTGGFSNGKLGGTSGGDAVWVTPGGCQAQEQPKPETVEANGVVTAVSSTQITAAGVTCTIPTNLSSTVTGLNLTANTTRVDMKCVAASGTNTLQSITIDNGHGDHSQGGEQHSPRHH